MHLVLPLPQSVDHPRPVAGVDVHGVRLDGVDPSGNLVGDIHIVAVFKSDGRNGARIAALAEPKDSRIVAVPGDVYTHDQRGVLVGDDGAGLGAGHEGVGNKLSVTLGGELAEDFDTYGIAVNPILFNHPIKQSGICPFDGS